jgi:hypothetical protein
MVLLFLFIRDIPIHKYIPLLLQPLSPWAQHMAAGMCHRVNIEQWVSTRRRPQAHRDDTAAASRVVGRARGGLAMVPAPAGLRERWARAAAAVAARAPLACAEGLAGVGGETTGEARGGRRGRGTADQSGR